MKIEIAPESTPDRPRSPGRGGLSLDAMGRGKRWDADLRRAIVSMCARGMHHDEVAWHTGVSARTVSRVIAQRKQHGEAAEEARRAMPPEDDARRMDFWVKIARLKAQGRTHAEVEAQLPPDDARALWVVDMCVAFGSSVTAPAEHGRFVARAGPESLFAAFSALFPDLCVLEAAEKKACKGMQKVSISFFNRALEDSGGVERQRADQQRAKIAPEMVECKLDERPLRHVGASSYREANAEDAAHGCDTKGGAHKSGDRAVQEGAEDSESTGSANLCFQVGDELYRVMDQAYERANM